MSLVDPVMQLGWDLIVQPADKLLTAADLDAFPTDLPSGPVDYELDNGRLVFIMTPPGGMHGSLQARISGHLLFQGELRDNGRVYSETGVVLWRDPDRVVSPDVAFVAKRSLPVRESPEGYLESIPELVVEIRSKGDSPAFLRRKVDHYLKAGVEVVWVVEPESTTITVHTASGGAIPHGLADVLKLPTIVPDFSLAVADVFRE
jgi:Uma2 family endonuclease